MHWSRELLALTAGVRWRIAGLVVIGLLIVAASLSSFIFTPAKKSQSQPRLGGSQAIIIFAF